MKNFSVVIKKLSIIFFILYSFLLIACKSNTPVSAPKQNTERMFWKIEGKDKDGKASAVYVQGTIHVGDERLYPLSKKVTDTWSSATRIVGEISTNDWAIFQTELSNNMIQSQIRSNGKNFMSKLTAQQKDTLFSFLGKESAEALAVYEPWVISTALDTSIYLKSKLSVERGMDGQLMILAYQQGKKMEGLDSLETQLEILQYGTYDEQLNMLKTKLDDLSNATKLRMATNDLYEAYLANDAKKLENILTLSRMADEARDEFYRAYYNKLFTERNKAWADKILQYLDEGGTTFVFAGCGHFVGHDSVFANLEKRGIKCEAVIVD